MKYILHHQGSEKGPWSFDEVLKQIHSKNVEWTDYVYDEQKKDWILLLDHPQFVEEFQKWKKPGAKPASPGTGKESNSEWYILRDENKYGPFAYLELIRMLQEKKLFEFDFVWNRAKMSSWQQISEVEDFKPEKIKEVRDKEGLKMTDVFFRRRHARASYGASILLHNNKEVWRGQSFEISAGGAGLKIESSEVQVGQTLFLHFKAGDGVPPFNAVCTVMSKKQKGKEFHYGVKFTSVSQSVQQAIQKYTSRVA